MVPALISMVGRVAGTRAAGTAAKGAGAAEGGSSQVMGLVQSVMGMADETKNLIKDIVGKPFADSAKKMEMGRSVVKNDANGLIQQIDMLPDGVKKFSQALQSLTTAVVDRGRELSNYNGNLAQSYGQNDVKKMMADIRESNYLGQSYSRVNDASTNFETKFMDAMNPVKDALATILAEILEKLNSFLDVVQDNIEYVVIASEAAVLTYQFLSGNWTGMVDTINAVPDKIEKAKKMENISVEFVRDIFKNSAKADQNLVPRRVFPNAEVGFGFK